MALLVALIREAQPGRVAEVRATLQAQAAAAARQLGGIDGYDVLQGRAQTNLYVDLIAFDSYTAWQLGRTALLAADHALRHLFLRSALVREYQPVTNIYRHHRDARGAGIGLIRVQPGHVDEYLNHVTTMIRTRFPERPGLAAAGVYQAEHEPEHVLIRSLWDTEADWFAHHSWIAGELFPLSDPWVGRREPLMLLQRWDHSRALAASEAGA